MQGSQYFLDIYNSSAARQTAFAFGDLAEVTFIARRRIAEMNGKGDTMRVRLVEIEPDEIGSLDDDNGPRSYVREVAVFEGDADTAAQALKRKLAAEKKQQQDLLDDGRTATEAEADRNAFGGDPEPSADEQ